jgi:hypothetical protein
MAQAEGQRVLQYQFQETIQGITYVYHGLEQDFVPAAGDVHGVFEDCLLWREGDSNSDKFVVIDVNVHPDKIVVFAYWDKNNWWKYRIFLSDQKYQRRKKDDNNWSTKETVTTLRVRCKDEPNQPTHSVVEVGIHGNGYDAVAEVNPPCQLTWNPATRRYTLRC